VNKSII